MIRNDPDKINTQVPPYEHPYYWASFIVTGKHTANGLNIEPLSKPLPVDGERLNNSIYGN